MALILIDCVDDIKLHSYRTTVLICEVVSVTGTGRPPMLFFVTIVAVLCYVQAKAVTTFSNATSVPTVKSVATLPGYGLVSDFNTTQRAKVCALSAHVLADCYL